MRKKVAVVNGINFKKIIKIYIAKIINKKEMLCVA